jgi:Zinc carboxypeptidase
VVSGHRSTASVAVILVGVLLLATMAGQERATAAASLVPPHQFIGFAPGTDNKVVRWDKILEYMGRAAAGSDRVRLRELGKTSGGNALVAVEISSADTIRSLDKAKQLARRLYFQDGPPAPRERDEIFRRGKVVVLVTCSVHANEIGPTQATLELVHELATSDSPAVKKILDNVILVLVPSLNPDGQILVTDWFNETLGTEYEGSPLPFLYHRYAGHDLNRDMYMFTQKESEYMARLAWHDWFPAVWLDAHQMGMNGPRIFVMPATDPINPNVHPLIYRWNTILGQSQAAALEAAGKHGIIYNSMYTNFWEGAMAWSGWWHNQIGLLTEIASVRVASPVDQLRARPDRFESRTSDTPTQGATGAPLMPPTDTLARTEYPRPWRGGRWTLRDIVDYQLIVTMATLETAADRREAILRQIYEVNRATVEDVRPGDVHSILVPVAGQHDPREVAHLVDRLSLGGVEVFRADRPFGVDGKQYAAGTFVIPMAQVFARYAKDLLEPQVYPDIRRSPDSAADLPYDVTAWSLGMKLGVAVHFVRVPLPGDLSLIRVREPPRMPGRLDGTGDRYTFPYAGADTSIAVNRLLKAGASISFEPPAVDGSAAPAARITVSGVPRAQMEAMASEFGLAVAASAQAAETQSTAARIRIPRIAMYAPWTGGNIDEGWTRWVLEQYEFEVKTIHNQDVRDGRLGARFDAIILPDQNPRDMLEGFDVTSVRPEYRGGIGVTGLEHLRQFVAAGGTIVALGAATDLMIDELALPVRNLRRGLRREQHYGPGSILRVRVDNSHPVGYGMARDTYGFYDNSPFFSLEGLGIDRTSVVARYPTRDVLASGWLTGEGQMQGRAAVVTVDMRPGRVVLFGLRPQHRAQTHATFPMLFNALYQATVRESATAPSH